MSLQYIKKRRVLQMCTNFRAAVAVVDIASNGTGNILLNVHGLDPFHVTQLRELSGLRVDTEFIYIEPSTTILERINETF